MADTDKIVGTAEAWETGLLGTELAHARRVPDALAKEIDESLEMQSISIRLPKSLIESFKLLGTFHGVGYQPLMRDALLRFAQSEMKSIVSGLVSSQKKGPVTTETPVPTKPPAPRRKAA